MKDLLQIILLPLVVVVVEGGEQQWAGDSYLVAHLVVVAVAEDSIHQVLGVVVGAVAAWPTLTISDHCPLLLQRLLLLDEGGIVAVVVVDTSMTIEEEKEEDDDKYQCQAIPH